MNRYKFLLNTTLNNNQIIGLFPWGTIIDTTTTDLKKDQITFFDSGMDFLRNLASKNVSVVLFINQFKPHPLVMDKLQSVVTAIENVVKEQGVTVIGTYWCPGVDRNDPFVVPNPGMFVRVTENTGIAWDNIPVLSASDVDLSAASKVKAAPILIGKEHKKYTSYNSLSEWIASI